ncbi:Imm49 family immunity protein [Ralstonia solanacearum species complex bacterium KE056]|uniref:Imm49 family immunity protein n=1 Tax=Ralstonia solanacearum species complex bacterium KE056 TaxID=3119585 RepID=UPI002FC27A9B
MNSDIIERKRRGVQSYMDGMPATIEKIRYRIKPISLKGCYSNLASAHISIGFFQCFANGDVVALKQNLYTACQLLRAAIAQDAHHEFGVGSEIFYALLSDSKEEIDVMGNLNPGYYVSARDNPLYHYFKVHMWQLAIQGDYAALEQKIYRLGKNGRKDDRALASKGRDFFSLLIKEDRQGLEDLIKKDADVKSEHAFTEDYLSFYAAFEAKLCWYRGIPVEIDHPLVPMDLMPIRPLADYDDVYDFLKPGWVPPQQGLMGKLSRWIGKRT